MMKRLVTLLFFLGLFLLAAALVAPGLIDWNRHKDEVVRQLSSYLQRKIDVAGDVSLQVIPQPEMMLEAVTVANAAEGKSGPFMTLKKLGVRIKFAPLLQGRVEVESLDLIEPVINFEVFSSGRTNWPEVLKEKSADIFSGAGAEVRLNQMKVTGGTLRYSNQATGARFNVEGLNLFVTADTLLGPYLIAGDILYRGLPVNIEVKTEKYDGISPLQAAFSFLPQGRMPQVKLNGVVDFRSGIDIQGEMSVAEGSLASLLDAGPFNSLGFMHETAELRGVMELKGGQFSLGDIKAKIGQKGDLRGKISVQFFRDRKPFVSIDAGGSNLALAGEPGGVYLAVPEGFSGSVRFKGKNIVWGGSKLAAADVAADFGQKEWKIKSALINPFPGTEIKLAGAALPAAGSGSYTVQLATDDLGKLAGALSPAENSAFKFLSDTGVARKFTLSSSLDVSPARVSFFNMDGLIEDKVKLSGVLNIDRTLPRPNFVARMNISGWDAALFPAAAYGAFLQKLMQSDADLELTLQNLVKNGVRIPEVFLKGKIDAQGISLQDMHGVLPGQGSFTLSGHMASFAPLSGADLNYTLKAERAQDITRILNVSLPSLLGALKSPNLKGAIKGDATQYTFSAEGRTGSASLELNGTAAPDGQGHDSYQVDLHLRDESADQGLRVLGLPIGKLAGGDGALDLSGELKGAGDHYRIDKLQMQIGAAKVSGYVERKGDAYVADLIAGKLDLDQWLAGDWPLEHSLSLTLRGDELSWQGLSITQPQLTAEADAASLRITGLQGKLWGGDLDSELAFTRQPSSVWSSSFKGSLKQAELNTLGAQLGLRGFSAWTGDIGFNLASDKNTPGTATGDVDVSISALTVEKFNFDKLGALIGQWTAVPPGLQQLVDASFRNNGATTFKDVRGQFKVNQGKATIESLNLSNASGAMELSGSADLKAGSYDISGSLLLKQPPGVQAIEVRRSAADYTVNSKPIEEFIIRTHPVPLEVRPVPPAAEASPPAQNGDSGVVGDILKRLEAEDGGSSKKP